MPVRGSSAVTRIRNGHAADATCAADNREIGRAIGSAQVFFGAPHAHGGAGVRKLKDRWYEVRCGLDLRLIFRDCGKCLSFEFMDSQDEVRRFLKGVI